MLPPLPILARLDFNMTNKKRVAILISGRGSNMAALINAAAAPDYPATIVGVISNRTDAPGLQLAQNSGIKTTAHPLKNYADKQASDAAISQTLADWNVDIICFAGFMRILSDEFTARWKGKMINIHPALLPKHKGLNTHQRALDAGDKVHGCTIHYIIPDLDAGPVILQAEIPIQANDSAETLAARVVKLEHVSYPKALAIVASGQ